VSRGGSILAIDQMSREANVVDAVNFRRNDVARYGCSVCPINNPVAFLWTHQLLYCKIKLSRFLTETITPTTIDTIKSLGIKTLLWQIDPTFDPIIWPHTNTVGRKVDLYITCEPGSVLTKLEKRGFKKLAYMLGASDGTTMRFLQNQPKKYDIVLIGTYHPFREKYLKVLKGKDVHIWGWGNWQDSSVKEMFEGKALSQKEMLKVYSQAKIVIDIRRSKSSTIPTNLRPFEAAQVGAFILLEYAYNLKDVFKLNKEVDYFKSPSDLRQKVNYYLAHPQKRKQ